MKKTISILTIWFAVTGLIYAGPEPISSGKEMKEVAPAPAPACNWNGFYVGFNAGYAWMDNDSIDTDARVTGTSGLGGSAEGAATAADLATFSLDNSNNGAAVGGQLGYNWQFGRFVFGPEADIDDIPNSNDTSHATTNLPVPGFPGVSITQTAGVSKSFEYIGTVRGRIGFAVTPCLLLYGTGGFAYSGVEAKTDLSQTTLGAGGFVPPYSAGTKFSGTQTGWTAGGGLEWMFSRHWAIRAEYLHYGLGGVTYNVPPLTAFGNFGSSFFYSTAERTHTSFDANAVRAGLDFKF